MDNIILRVYSLSMRAKINGEMNEDAEIWTDVLFEIVPREMLLPSLKLAIQKKSGSFAPNAFDLRDAYNEICEAETAERKKVEEEAARNNPVLRCSNKHLHQNEKGDVWRSFSLEQDDELVPCETCRPDEFLNWKRKQIALYGEHQPLTRLQNQNTRPTYQNLKNPIECLNHAQDGINRRMVEAIGTPEYSELFGQRKFIFNVLKYVWEHDGR